MKRLYELTKKEINEWREERQRVGNEKYGREHLRKYNLVDVMEELLDAINILNLFHERMEKQNINYPVPDKNWLQKDIQSLIEYIQRLDKMIPDKVCTDNTYRIWWGGEDEQNT